MGEGQRVAISDEEVAALLEQNGQEGAPAVRPYDFSAQRINRTQLPVLEVISKTFADKAGASLSALLGREVAMHFDSLESVKCADLQASLPVPASLAVVRLKPLAGFAYLGVEPDLLLTLLDAFFGGTGRANAGQAAISPAAQRFLALLLRSLAPDLTAAWSSVAALELELVKQETNPRLVHFGGVTESVTVARYTVEFAARSGRIDWLFPDSLLGPLRESLAGGGASAPARKQEAWAPLLAAALKEATLEVRAVLAQAQISLRELVSLAPGDIIPIESPQLVRLMAEDVPLYHGRFGISQGHNALKILPGASA